MAWCARLLRHGALRYPIALALSQCSSPVTALAQRQFGFTRPELSTTRTTRPVVAEILTTLGAPELAPIISGMAATAQYLGNFLTERADTTSFHQAFCRGSIAF